MSEFRGTPGAWEVRVEQIAPGSNAACFTVATDDFDVVSPLLGIRCEDDAALIAAAPDLLEALLLVREDIVVAGGHDNYCAYVLDKHDWRRDGAPQSERPPCNCWQADAVRKIDAAIAKALNTNTTER